MHNEIQERNIHRIGGASIENLRLKPKEGRLNPPGISVIKTPTPGEAAAEMRAAYPDATGLHEAAKTIGSSTIEAIQNVVSTSLPCRVEGCPITAVLSIQREQQDSPMRTSHVWPKYSRTRRGIEL